MSIIGNGVQQQRKLAQDADIQNRMAMRNRVLSGLPNVAKTNPEAIRSVLEEGLKMGILSQDDYITEGSRYGAIEPSLNVGQGRVLPTFPDEAPDFR